MDGIHKENTMRAVPFGISFSQSESIVSTDRRVFPGTFKYFMPSSATKHPSEYTSAVPVKPAGSVQQADYGGGQRGHNDNPYTIRHERDYS